jgi:hypothetical protein
VRERGYWWRIDEVSDNEGNKIFLFHKNIKCLSWWDTPLKFKALTEDEVCQLAVIQVLEEEKKK